MVEHVLLFVVDAAPGSRQPVEVESLGDGTTRVLASPGFVEGIAAGDIIRIVDETMGSFVVVRRGGNLAVKILRDGPIQQVTDRALHEVERLGGTLDGSIERGAVFTIPASAGLATVEGIFNALANSFTGVVWWFGNVHDEDGKPLNSWLEEER
jgi:hypothetical protein